MSSTTARAGQGLVVTNITERPFVSRQHGIGDIKDPFTKTKIQSELRVRLAGATYPDQGASSLCGPACFFYCLLIDNPKAYETAIWELWKNGETQINSLNIKPSERAKNPKDLFDSSDIMRVSAIDWISLASLRDSSNTLMSYSSPFDQVAGITVPGEIISWFTKAGYKHIDTLILDKPNNITRLNNFQRFPDYHIISLVNSGFISNQSFPNVNHPNHWVVWTEQLRKVDGTTLTDKINSNDFVSLKLFTWGSIHKPLQARLTFEEFQKYHFEAIIMGYNV